MTLSRIPIVNKLLAAVPRADYQQLLKNLEPVTLTFGEILYQQGVPIKYVYFPNNSLVSLLTVVDRRSALEVGMVGQEGMIGIAVALGVKDSSFRATVQGTGTAMRMKKTHFLKALEQSPALHRAVKLYIHVLMAQIAQTAACNRFHAVPARLARWLLMTRERVSSNQFHLTQEFLSHMLGVRRVGVTHGAQMLREQNLIEYSRGDIHIINVKGLAAAACSCYEKIKGKH